MSYVEGNTLPLEDIVKTLLPMRTIVIFYLKFKTSCTDQWQPSEPSYFTSC